MKTGAQTFDAFLRRSKQTNHAFAVESGIGDSLVSLYRRGLRKPGRKYAALIERLSDGRVPASCW